MKEVSYQKDENENQKMILIKGNFFVDVGKITCPTLLYILISKTNIMEKLQKTQLYPNNLQKWIN